MLRAIHRCHRDGRLAADDLNIEVPLTLETVAYPKLANPPIQEALVDVRVRSRPSLSSQELDAVYQHVRDELPKKEAIRSVRAHIRLEKADEPMHPTASDNGWLYKSSDESLLLQCRLDGMTVNKLRPYSSYNELFERFRRYWDIYQAVAKPVLATRLALRYINRFQVPSEGIVDHYLKYAPRPFLPDMYTTGFTQATTHAFQNWKGRVNLITALTPSVHDSATSVVVDIDAYCEDGFADDEVENCFQKLHAAKNDVFFSVIGDRAMESFR